MKTWKMVAIIVAAVALTFGGFYGIMQVDHAQRMERRAADQCWFAKGDWKDGKCERPQDRLSPEAKVCMGLAGAYHMVKDGNLTCHKQDGTEIPLPDLRDKEVYVMRDGAVAVKGPDRIDYYMGAR